MTKYAQLEKVKNDINQDVIREVIATGKKICRIYYKVIHGVLVMVSIDRVVKPEIDKTKEIIKQLMKDSKRKYNFNDEFIFTYSIPMLTEAV